MWSFICSTALAWATLKTRRTLGHTQTRDKHTAQIAASALLPAQYCPDAGHVKDAPWGTLVFMAPERFKRNIQLPASDVWSFGVMLVGGVCAWWRWGAIGCYCSAGMSAGGLALLSCYKCTLPHAYANILPPPRNTPAVANVHGQAALRGRTASAAGAGGDHPHAQPAVA